MTEQQPKRITRHELEAELTAKAWKDEAFKQELINNPKAAYINELQQQLPENLEIRVLEETSTTLYLIIPQKPANMQFTEELSQEALESVAGGATSFVLAPTTILNYLV